LVKEYVKNEVHDLTKPIEAAKLSAAELAELEQDK
jgi:hypothetical protein